MGSHLRRRPLHPLLPPRHLRQTHPRHPHRHHPLLVPHPHPRHRSPQSILFVKDGLGSLHSSTMVETVLNPITSSLVNSLIVLMPVVLVHPPIKERKATSRLSLEVGVDKGRKKDPERKSPSQSRKKNQTSTLSSLPERYRWVKSIP